MIFCGDIAIPSREVGEAFMASLAGTGIMHNKTVVANMEGVFKKDVTTFPYYKLFNDYSILGLNNLCKQVVFSLANNHTYDFPDDIKPTVEVLIENHMGYFGLIEDDAIKPYEFLSNGRRYAIFGHCWSLYTKTNPNKRTSDRVVDCSYDEFFNIVKMYCNNHSDLRVICFPHWNYDFEELPFPAYVKLAHDLIDAGVWCVVGNHTHCTQPVEVYHNRVICYSLGNFCIPNGIYFEGKLSYPEKSLHYIVDISEEEEGAATVYTCRTSSDGKSINVLYDRVITNDSSAHENLCWGGVKYIDFFKKHRTKRRFTPIFTTFHNTLGNKVKMCMLRWKVTLIRLLASFRHRKNFPI